MWDLFEWGSSKVDWCEKNFIHVYFVAEFYNTISNILFLTMPPLLIYLFQPYSKQVSKGANIVFLLLFIVGVGSAYFHCTLSLLGQLLDEIAILWVLMAAIAIWFPIRHMPSVFNGDRKMFQTVIIPLSIISTILCCVIPEVNAFVLMLFGGPIIWLLFDEYQRTNDIKVKALALRSAALWLLGVICWTNDKFLCDTFWYRFPYLHSGWHILIFVSSYAACVLFAYFQVLEERPELEVSLRYWPKQGGYWEFLGVPYVFIDAVDLDTLSTHSCWSQPPSFVQEKLL
ncbi:alkaline ceramidase 2-like isoform X2 [Watersipora subatra]